MVVSVFAGCGKTWLANHQNKYGYSMRDSDSSTYEKTAGWEKEYINAGSQDTRNPSKSRNFGLWAAKWCFGPISLTALYTITQSSVTQFGQTAKPCRTRNFRIKSWISLRNGLTKPEKEAHQKLLHILANSIVLKLYDR